MKHKLNQAGSHIITLVAALVLVIAVVAVLCRVLNIHSSSSSQNQSVNSQGTVAFETSSSCTQNTHTITKDGLSVTTNVDYMNVSQGGLCLDVYRKDDNVLRPVVALLHGSVKNPNSLAGRDSLISESEQLAEAGFVAVNIDWPPQYTYHMPADVNAVDTALSFIKVHGTPYNINTGSIGLLGTSGGGLLAGYVATQNISGLKAVVTWSGVFFPNDPNVVNNPGLGAKSLNDWFGCKSVSSCPELAQYNTVQRVSSSTPPFALFNSSDELIPVSQPNAMKAALSAAGVPVELTIYPGNRHAVAYESDAMQPSIEWFQKYLQ